MVGRCGVYREGDSQGLAREKNERWLSKKEKEMKVKRKRWGEIRGNTVKVSNRKICG